MPTLTHPSAERLKAFGLGRLPAAEQVAVEEHIQACDTCCETLARVEADTLLDLARDASAAAPPAEMTAVPDLPPELVDHPRYRVVAPLGEGGMGVVYKAEHKVMGRMVALKVINRQLTANAKAVERFRREVKNAAQLNHPNIVTAHDAEEADGLHFLVMEYVDGQTLDRFVSRRGPLAVPMACLFIRQVAQGLNHAHQQGLIHRDIKPQNLMVTRKGQVKILDFGLSRLSEETRTRPHMTAPNLIVGTPDFLAPEQARSSHRVDIRTDLYSLGCTFYYLLTGSVPFPGDNAFEKLIAHTDREPTPVRDLRPDVPDDVAAVVQKLMAKNPDDRYATPADLSAALAPLAKPGATAMVEMPAVVPAPRIEPSASVATVAMAGAAPADTVPDVAAQRRPSKKRPRRRRRPNLAPLGVVAAFAFCLVVLAGGVWAAVNYWPARSSAGTGARAGGNNSSNGNGIESAKGNDLRPQPGASAGGGGVAPTKGNDLRPRPGAPAGGGPGVLVVFPNRGLYYPDYDNTVRQLKADEVVVRTASTSRDACRYMAGTEPGPSNFRADLILDESIPLDDYAAVLVVGGQVAEYMPGEPGAESLKQLLGRARESRKVIGGICTGQAVLAALGFAGPRQGVKTDYLKPYVLPPFAEHTMAMRGWMEYPSVRRSGSLVMAGRATDGAEFARTVLTAMGEK